MIGKSNRKSLLGEVAWSKVGVETFCTGPAAPWDVANPAQEDGTTDRNPTDPDWVWNLSGPTRVGGYMPIQFWASCAGCNDVLQADWFISVWADGVKKFEQRVTLPPDNPNVTQLLGTTLYLHENFPAETTNPITANTKIVVAIDPVYVDIQNNTHIYYDSQMACTGTLPTTTAPCDSQL